MPLAPEQAFTMPDPDLSDAVRETEFQLLEEAFQDEPKEPDAAPKDEAEPELPDAPETQAQPEGEKPTAEARERDPKTGQFVEGKQPGEAEAEIIDNKGDEPVPRWRLKEMAEERRQFQAEAQALRAELARRDLLAQQQQRQQQAQQPQPELDPLTMPPQQLWQTIRGEINDAVGRERLNTNLAFAHIRHGETFEKAYSAMLTQAQNGDGQIVRQFVSQPNPGEAIVQWWKQNELIRETGGDISKFKEHVKASTREELLKDPEFRRSIIEAMRSEANGGSAPGGNGARNVVQLPPSLHSTGNAGGSGEMLDDSDAGVFANAWR